MSKLNPRYFLSNLIVFFCSFLLIFLVLEGAFRLWHSFYSFDFGQMVEPHPVLGWKLKENLDIYPKKFDPKFQYRSNRYGLRDDRPNLHKDKNIFRILVLGDSMTEGREVRQEKLWTKELEILLNAYGSKKNIQVLNGACAGYGSYQELQWLKLYGLKFEPDLVLVAFHTNDVLNDVYAKRITSADRKRKRKAFADSAKSRNTSLKDKIKKHSFLYQFIANRIKESSQWEPFFKKLGMIQERAIEEDPPRRILDKTLEFKLMYGRLSTKEYESFWAATLDSLAEIKEVADQYHFQMGLLYLPPMFSYSWEDALRAVGGVAENYDSSLPDQRLGNLAHSLKIPYRNLTPGLRSRGGKGLYLRFNRHLNERGHAAVAEDLVPWILKNFDLT